MSAQCRTFTWMTDIVNHLNNSREFPRAIDRRAYILKVLSERKTVTIDTLCQELHVTAATVRKDLTALAETGRLIRVRSGAAKADPKPRRHTPW